MQDNMQRNGNTHAACASCKHQRKKCGEDCILHPYFPAEKCREFQAVHKVFGVSNIVKLMKSVALDDRQKLSESLIWEACCRQKDPVSGPYGEYTKISDELKLYKTQLLNQNHTVANQPTTTTNCQNQLLISPHAGTIMNKPTTLPSWNGTKGIATDLDSMMIDPSSYIYNSNFSNYGLPKLKRHEKENSAPSSLVISQPPPQQQYSVNASYNQQYYLSGQYGCKRMDNTIWEDGL